MSCRKWDRYYTPPATARIVVEAAEASGDSLCLDSSCGDGSLLSAADEVLERVKCCGMDVDEAAIRRLRRAYPKWTLSTADALESRSWSRVQAARDGVDCQLAVLNPPFSMSVHKGVCVTGRDYRGRCSVAMAHVLSVIEHASPAVCAAIVPESLLCAELDAPARTALRETYVLREGPGLHNTTFRGARANAVVISLRKRSRRRVSRTQQSESSPRSMTIVRGGLPVHEACNARKGLGFLHTTDIGACGSNDHNLRMVHGIERGRISGHAVLLPRVGLPRKEHARALQFKNDVQLSDCVIALVFATGESARLWQDAIRREWRSLLSIYGGTGARFTTVARVRQWAARIEETLSK